MIITVLIGVLLIISSITFERKIQKIEQRKPSLFKKLIKLIPLFRGLAVSLLLAGFLFFYFTMEDHWRQISSSNISKVYELKKCLRLILACAGVVGFLPFGEHGSMNIYDLWLQLAGAFAGFCIGTITLLIANKFCTLSAPVLIMAAAGFALVGFFLLFAVYNPLKTRWQKQMEDNL